MDIYSNLRRNIVLKGNTYTAGDLFDNLIKEDSSSPEIDNPEFYDVETHTLKLGNLCIRETQKNEKANVIYDGVPYTTYCSLLQLSNNLNKDLQNNLHKDLDTVYNFLRRDLSIDNRRKFHNLIKVLMGYDNQANSINLVAEYIRKTDSADDITISLDLFRKKDIGEDDIEKFLKQAKHSGYKEYERSFVGSHFKTNENKLFLRYKGEDESRSIYQIVKAVINDELTVKESIGYLYELIVGNYTSHDMVKGDLECIKPVYNKNGEKIIDSGEIVEVKKLDHGGDSYLSEFFAIYKNSNIPKDALKPKFIKTYNNLIDGLYELFKTSGNNILEDIKNNFAGIIYSQNTLITSDDIELYWSNKGRSSCSKDHRLSIRYRINKTNINGYTYENNEDVLLDKKIKIKLDRDKIICPILKPKTISESFKLEDVSDLLLEGRKEDIIKKYSKINSNKQLASDIEYLSVNDPSGNNKYLDWMVKIYLGLGKDSENFKGTQTGSKLRIWRSVKKFHENIQRIKNKDINSYPNLGEFELVVNEAEEKRKLAEIKKEAKKQKTVIYEDDKWFVVSPHSWKASCYYGAGTKWCVTMKDNSNHWDRYSRRAVFFYVIDKTKDKTDMLYKVAYRKIGSGDKFELWDAGDAEITHRKVGREWLDSLPEVMKEKINIYHKEKYPKDSRPEWTNDDPRAQALLNHIGDVGIEFVDDSHYGMSVYDTDEGYYVVGDDSEMDDALWNYYDDYSDGELAEDYDYDGYHIQMYDEEQFIDEQVESYLDDTSDDEMLEMTGKDSRYEDIDTEVEVLRGEKSEIHVETDEEEERVNDIEFQIEELISEQSNLIDEAKEEVESREKQNWEDCLYHGVVECLVHDRGWYRNSSDLLDSGVAELDRTGLIDSLVSDSDYENLTHGYGYTEEIDDDGDWWFIFEIDY
tara:strand:+ start:3012 stop:5774 length:2763 start_codon:yes stop_codon:yes gene_type:complete